MFWTSHMLQCSVTKTLKASRLIFSSFAVFELLNRGLQFVCESEQPGRFLAGSGPRVLWASVFKQCSRKSQTLLAARQTTKTFDLMSHSTKLKARNENIRNGRQTANHLIMGSRPMPSITVIFRTYCHCSLCGWQISRVTSLASSLYNMLHCISMFSSIYNYTQYDTSIHSFQSTR